MKKIVFWGIALVVLAAINFLIIKKEDTLANGRTMLLRLAPLDPRSLIQGDYMELRYAIVRDVPRAQLQKDRGYLVVSLDANHVAKFVRVHQGETLEQGEYLLFYRNRGEVRLGAESFMFHEGDAKLYERARYGELKVDGSGASVLVGLCGEDFRPLSRMQRSSQK